MLLSFLALSMFSSLAAAQYTNEVTTPVTIGSDGTFTGSAQDIGVSYEILGTAGATGSVTAQVYNGNPQSTASIPEGISLTHFIVITFNMNSGDFLQATINISFTDQDVASLKAPYTIYKYDAGTNRYVAVSTFDTTTKTATVTVTSIDDPLFAIGGATAPAKTGGYSTETWALLAASTVIVIVLAIVGVWYLKRKQY